MRDLRPRLVALGCLVAATALLGGCGGGSRAATSSPGTSGTPSVAVEAPVTGPDAALGQDIVRGVELALAQAPIQGQRVDVVVANDRDSTSTGPEVARSVVARHVVAVIGPVGPELAQRVLPVYRRAHVVALPLSPSPPPAGSGVSVVPDYEQAAAAEAQELVEVLGAGSVGIIYGSSDTRTATMASEVRSLLASAGVSVPAYVALSPGTSPQSLEAQVASVRPDAWYLAAPGDQSAVASGVLESAGSAPCLVDLVAGAGPYPPGCLAAALPDVAQMPGGSSYSAAYVSRYHSQPGLWGAFAYDSMQLLLRSEHEARTWRFGPLSSALDHQAGYEGVTGDITIDPSTCERVYAPVVVLESSSSSSPGAGVGIDPDWAAFSGYATQAQQQS